MSTTRKKRKEKNTVCRTDQLTGKGKEKGEVNKSQKQWSRSDKNGINADLWVNKHYQKYRKKPTKQLLDLLVTAMLLHFPCQL